MATITVTFGSGGANVAPGGANGSPDLATALRDLIDDVTAIRTALVATTAKLDADAGVTDTNYGALNNPAALKSIKG
jgi:hypothetical protein